MKRISTLLLSVTLFTTAFAQTDAEREEAKRVILGERKSSTSYPRSGDDRDVIYDDNRTVYGGKNSRYPERYPTTYSSKERRIYEINREYDAKIYSIRQNRALSRYEKERIIRQLESERRRKMAQVTDNYSKDRRYNTDDDDCDDNRKNKRNKGNRFGWSNGNRNSYYGK